MVYKLLVPESEFNLPTFLYILDLTYSLDTLVLVRNVHTLVSFQEKYRKQSRAIQKWQTHEVSEREREIQNPSLQVKRVQHNLGD